jgi:hypothetical protein
MYNLSRRQEGQETMVQPLFRPGQDTLSKSQTTQGADDSSAGRRSCPTAITVLRTVIP